MKNLHNDAELFSDVIVATSKALTIAPAIIEKDYNVVEEKLNNIIVKMF